MVFKDERAVAEAFHSEQKVEGLTHNFYRYPARFNPEFARRMILEFSDVGDVVLDPFMGGGTTVVEALAAGRRAVGVDINGLAHFVTKVKTTPLSERDAGEIEEWLLALSIREGPIGAAVATSVGNGVDPRARNMPEEIGQSFAAILESVQMLRFPRQRNFLRCALLAVGQWALEARRDLPTAQEIVQKLREEVYSMLEGMRELVGVARDVGIKKNKITGVRALFYGSATEPLVWGRILEHGWRPKLVLTSPPYPGVHILYHRWQVSGRRETPAPYWVADLRDGHGSSYYTMGSRSILGLKNYFSMLAQSFRNLRAILPADALVVQLVAFSNADVQLPLYLDAVEKAGFAEVPQRGSFTGEQVRLVPNRKWYTYWRQDNDASREVLMIHRVRA